MRGNRKVSVGLGIATIVVLGIGAAIQLGLVGGSEPTEAAFASPSAPGPPGTATDGTTTETTSTDGTWVIDSESGSLDDATSTYAGYRIEEELGGVGANTAVGRTQEVSGQLVIDGTRITELSVEVDMTTLRSDDDRRDGQLAERGLETSAFPTATFVLSEPIELDQEPAEGKVVEIDAIGDLTLHGVTRSVTVPIQAKRSGDVIEAVASVDVALADYDIDPPTGFLVLSIAETGTVELHLLFVPA